MQSLPFARFAGVSPNEKIRAFLARGNLTLCRFRLGQPAVVVYKAVFPTCSRGDARLTFQVSVAENLGVFVFVPVEQFYLALPLSTER